MFYHNIKELNKCPHCSEELETKVSCNKCWKEIKYNKFFEDTMSTIWILSTFAWILFWAIKLFSYLNLL